MAKKHLNRLLISAGVAASLSACGGDSGGNASQGAAASTPAAKVSPPVAASVLPPAPAGSATAQPLPTPRFSMASNEGPEIQGGTLHAFLAFPTARNGVPEILGSPSDGRLAHADQRSGDAADADLAAKYGPKLHVAHSGGALRNAQGVVVPAYDVLSHVMLATGLADPGPESFVLAKNVTVMTDGKSGPRTHEFEVEAARDAQRVVDLTDVMPHIGFIMEWKETTDHVNHVEDHKVQLYLRYSPEQKDLVGVCWLVSVVEVVRETCTVFKATPRQYDFMGYRIIDFSDDRQKPQVYDSVLRP